MAQIFPEGAGMDKAEDPVQLPDGTLRCLTHHLESCETCGVDYTFMREVLAEDAYEEEQRQIKRAKRNATVSSRLSNAKKCIDGCAALEGTTKRCSACKVKFYCSEAHQRQDFPTHKAACKQLALQMHLSAKLRAVFTRAFVLQNSNTKTTIQDLEDIQSGERYNLAWKKNGQSGKEEAFKWRGSEPLLHLLHSTPSSLLDLTPDSNPRTSCGLANRMQIMLEASPHRDAQDASVARDGLHALATIRDQDTFYGLAINYTLFGTSLPWSPCHCLNLEEEYLPKEDDEDYEARMEEIEQDKLNPFPSLRVTKGRAHWDPLFKRAQANPLDVQCMFEQSPTGCIGRKICPFRHQIG